MLLNQKHCGLSVGKWLCTTSSHRAVVGSEESCPPAPPAAAGEAQGPPSLLLCAAHSKEHVLQFFCRTAASLNT